MDYGGSERRKTKKDLKRKRLARGYKKGGKFRTHEVSEEEGEESKVKGKKRNTTRGVSSRRGAQTQGVPLGRGKK